MYFHVQCIAHSLQKHTSKTMGDFKYLHITGVNDLPAYL